MINQCAVSDRIRSSHVIEAHRQLQQISQKPAIRESSNIRSVNCELKGISDYLSKHIYIYTLLHHTKYYLHFISLLQRHISLTKQLYQTFREHVCYISVTCKNNQDTCGRLINREKVGYNRDFLFFVTV